MSHTRAPLRSISRLALAALLAVLLIVSGQVRAEIAAPLSALQAATIFCHAGQGADHGKPVLPHQSQQAAVLHNGLAGVALLALSPMEPALPRPQILRAAPRRACWSRGPPGRAIAAAYPRGPPVPV